MNGKVPTISVDKTDGCLLYLNETNLDTQIVTAKSSEMNVAITQADGDLVSDIFFTCLLFSLSDITYFYPGILVSSQPSGNTSTIRILSN